MSELIWREPAEETVDIYPGLVVCDNRVSGSITMGRSRLPIWCFTNVEFPEWDDYGDAGKGEPHYGVSKEHMRGLIYDLFEMRGEFARLLLTLAKGEWLERHDKKAWPTAWWDRKGHRKAVIKQLRRCLATLEALEDES